ncbi:hypothetical protein UCRPA7_2174 [Phaeoacremonium minimum UCRPA7]|uniref:Uncharacterized protein n=1 Tax=Phaeoacremonium minimum (strain UCR-PA7) TaxID=1286976 RepID=R8BSH2_PHAM7|nr:hypothetical protein UCRPA7_2174 [Phaeoacremonium minimum UCRPA7]EOO02286.1 hypothetical protein UCRPA7_2174 [Phaeoacremonium minimum UCRPA7]
MALISVVLFLAVVAIVVGWKYGIERRPHRDASPALEKAEDAKAPPVPDMTIEPLEGFDWKATEPVKIRPFKPVFHITMALQSTAPSDLIVMDYNYKERVLGRRELIAEHTSTVSGFIPMGVSAVEEAYSYLLTDYLPVRFPTMFTLSEDRKTFNNLVTEVSWPTTPPADTLEALKILGETVEDDIFLLHKTDRGHLAVAFVCCYSSGFDPSSKLGKILEEIHAPVPSYNKIGASMERFFSRLEVGKNVKRVNWSITPEATLFNTAGNHVHEEDLEWIKQDDEIDMDKARMRMELQTLSRFPKTQAIMFSFKTLLYPVKDAVAEGLGPQLADAIEGLPKGNAPGMWTYKGGIRWGKSVLNYLRAQPQP